MFQDGLYLLIFPNYVSLGDYYICKHLFLSLLYHNGFTFVERRWGNGNLSNKFSSCHTRLISISHSISLKTFLFSKQAVGHDGIQLERKKLKHTFYPVI